MGDTKTRQLHIYCVCGQKMKVTEEMFGRPGKCVKCRQKIWVPRADQLREGTQSIFLREHPEFLRKVRRHGGRDDRGNAQGSASSGAAHRPREGLLPLDPLKPLQVIWSLDYRLHRRLSRLESGREEAKPGEDQETLNEQLREVEEARRRLEDALRERLTEVDVELGATVEKISEARKQARAGTLSWSAYENEMTRLRKRREVLERRLHNCQGWLAARDAHVAGGYLDATVEDLPQASFRLTLPPEPDPALPLHAYYLGLLRDNLKMREDTGRRLDDLAASDDAASRERERIGIRLQRVQAKARVYFVRQALKRLDADCAAGIAITEAQQEALRETKRKALVQSGDFQSAMRALQRARQEARGQRMAIAAGLRAQTAEEAPDPDVTPRPRDASHRLGLFSGWGTRLTWLGALLLVLGLFLPFAGGRSAVGAVGSLPGHGPPAVLLVWGGLGAAISALLASLLPNRAVRGALLVFLWLSAALGAVIFLHEARYGLGPLGQRIRAEAWYVQPGFLSAAAGLGLLAAASWLTLAPVSGLRFAPPLAALLLAAGAAVVVTDTAGLRRPQPTARVTSSLQANVGPPLYETTVTLRNDGRRTLALGDDSDLPHGYSFELQREVSPGVWRETHLPSRISLAGDQLGTIAGDLPLMAIPPGAEARLAYVLGPGVYRVVLEEDVVRTFTLDEPARSSRAREEPDGSGGGRPTQGGQPEPQAGAAGANRPDGRNAGGPSRRRNAPRGGEETLEDLPDADAEVIAVLSVQGGEPVARIEVRPEGEEPVVKDVRLGDTVYGPWVFAEFDTEHRRVTLSDGERYLILRRGEPVDLAPPSGEQSG